MSLKKSERVGGGVGNKLGVSAKHAFEYETSAEGIHEMYCMAEEICCDIRESYR